MISKYLIRWIRKLSLTSGTSKLSITPLNVRLTTEIKLKAYLTDITRGGFKFVKSVHA